MSITERMENIAAISYGIAGMTNAAGLTFYEQHCDALEGEAGMFRYFVAPLAEEFSAAEESISQAFEWDWYCAIDNYIMDVLAMGDRLPTDTELRELALKAIHDAKDES